MCEPSITRKRLSFFLLALFVFKGLLHRQCPGLKFQKCCDDRMFLPVVIIDFINYSAISLADNSEHLIASADYVVLAFRYYDDSTGY